MVEMVKEELKTAWIAEIGIEVDRVSKLYDHVMSFV